MKKQQISRGLAVFLTTLVLTACGNTATEVVLTTEEWKQDKQSQAVVYELVDETTITSEAVQNWLEIRSKEQGTDGFNDRDGGWTYLLISYGETTSTTAEIHLHSFDRQGENSLITYEFINEGHETGELRRPKLLLRVPLQDGWRTDFRNVTAES